MDMIQHLQTIHDDVGLCLQIVKAEKLWPSELDITLGALRFGQITKEVETTFDDVDLQLYHLCRRGLIKRVSTTEFKIGPRGVMINILLEPYSLN